MKFTKNIFVYDISIHKVFFICVLFLEKVLTMHKMRCFMTWQRCIFFWYYLFFFLFISLCCFFCFFIKMSNLPRGASFFLSGVFALGAEKESNKWETAEPRAFTGLPQPCGAFHTAGVGWGKIIVKRNKIIVQVQYKNNFTHIWTKLHLEKYSPLSFTPIFHPHSFLRALCWAMSLQLSRTLEW